MKLSSKPQAKENSDSDLLVARGFSTIEAMIAIGILSVVAFAFMGWMSMVNKGTVALNETSDINNAMTQVTAAFGDDDAYCKFILQDKPLAGSKPDGVEVTEIDFYNLSGTEQSNALTKDKPLTPKSSVKVKDMFLKPVVELNTIEPTTKIIISDLEINFAKGSSTFTTKRIPIYATVESGLVKKCSISGANTLVFNERLCEVKYDGYNFYAPSTIKGITALNPKTGDYCTEKPGVVWTPGATFDTATCNPGYKVAVSKMHSGDIAPLVCRVQTSTGATILPRYYKSGAKDESGLNYLISIDTPPTTCSFSYLTGADLTGTINEVKCYPE